MKKVNYKKVFNTLDKILEIHSDALQGADFIVGISRGGLFPAMHVSTKLVKPLVAAYIDKQDNVYFDRDEWVIGKSVLLVDDIVRSGKTLSKVKGLLLGKGVKKVETLTIFHLRNNVIHPTYSEETEIDIEFPWDENRN